MCIQTDHATGHSVQKAPSLVQRVRGTVNVSDVKLCTGAGIQAEGGSNV